jgi:hypothetical protein
VLLKAGPAYGRPDSEAVIWEHGRRNFALRAEGVLAVVGPVLDDTEPCGGRPFPGRRRGGDRIIDGDPGVQAGRFTHEVDPSRRFPGDRLGG